MTWTLGHKAVVLAGAAVLLVVTAVASLSRGFIFMPQMDMPNVSVTVTMPEGADMDRASDLADQVLQRIDQVAGQLEPGLHLHAPDGHAQRQRYRHHARRSGYGPGQRLGGPGLAAH